MSFLSIASDETQMMRMRVQMTELLYNIIPNSAPYEGSVITDFTVVLNYVFVVTSGSFH